jgi:membrane dipeptidase
MIKALTSRNGVIGTAFFNGFLDFDWAKNGRVKNEVTLSTVIKHMKHVCELAGDTLHSAVGSDFDGGFGREAVPSEIDTVADLQKLGKTLSSEGFSGSDVSNMLSGNWIRLLERTLPH